MAGIFKDFIPEGEETGAIGSGFKDFVPDPVEALLSSVEAADVLNEEVVVEEVKAAPKKQVKKVVDNA